MKTTVRNILTNQESIFVNDFTPKHNLINQIILNRKQTSLILDKNHRSKIEKELNIVEKLSLNGDKIAFCYELDLMARQKSN